MADKPDNAAPPSPAPLARRLRFTVLQGLGVVMIVAMPVLAMLNVFGERRAVAEMAAPTGGLELQVDYATVFRYSAGHALKIRVRRISSAPPAPVAVAISKDYLDGFARVLFTPRPRTVDENDYIIALDVMQPGETRWITLDLQGQRPGWHRGRVAATAGTGTPVTVTIQTFLFP